MSQEALAIPLKAAAELLSLKDSRTIVKYIREGRLRSVGSGNGQRVVRASIDEYLEGKSEWHRRQNQGTFDFRTDPRSAPSARSSGRSRRKSHPRSDTNTTDTITFLRGRKLQRI